MFYNQPLPITRHQVRFYANKYTEQLPKVSTAFKLVRHNIIVFIKEDQQSNCPMYIPQVIRDNKDTNHLIHTMC